MSTAVKQADTATASKEQPVVSRRAFSLSPLRYLPGLGLVALGLPRAKQYRKAWKISAFERI